MKATRRQLELELARWAEFAMLCDSPARFFYRKEWQNLIMGVGDLYFPTGLCGLVHNFTGTAKHQMLHRMETNRPSRSGVWWWPHTRKGWQARSRFCWKMAELCQLDIESQ